MIADEIIPSHRAGGATSSHTILIPALSRVLESVDHDADPEAYEQAVVDDNVLGKGTTGRGGEHSGISRSSISCDPTRSSSERSATSGRMIPRATAPRRPLRARTRPVLPRKCGGDLRNGSRRRVTSRHLAEAVASAFSGRYNEATLAKIGRNTFSSWEQTGHLDAVARTRKLRRRAICTPSTTAYALLLGHLEGVGEALFDTFWTRVLDQPGSHLVDLAAGVAADAHRLPPERRHHRGGVHRAPSTDGGTAVVSRVDDLIANYQRFAQLPWPSGLAPAQRVWMAVYPPEDERRLRLHLPEFETASKAAGHEWVEIDITNAFEEWMAVHEYRDAYFANPKLIQPELAGFLDDLVARVRQQLAESSTPNTVVGLVGAGSLFGLGDHVKVSALIDRIEDLIRGRLLVFFPARSIRTTTDCWTGVTAGTTTPSLSLPTRGRSCDADQPRRLRDRSDRARHPEPRRRQGQESRRRAATGRRWSGSCEASSARASTSAGSSESSTSSSAT